jgi:hypothetical protein
MMAKGSIIPLYKAMSPEDQQTFKRWAKANLVLASIFAVAFAAVAMGDHSSLSNADRTAPVANHAASLQVR